MTTIANMTQFIVFLGLIAVLPFSSQSDPQFLVIPFRVLQNLGLEVKHDYSSKEKRNEISKKMNINSNSNIQVPMEIAKELGLLKGNGCGGGGGGSLCGKAMSETAVNGGGATTSNFPSGPVFSVGQAAPPGEVHPDLLTLNLKGKDGKKGKDGPVGPAGDAGPAGPQGPPGPKGDVGDPCNPTKLPTVKGCNPDALSSLQQRLDKLEKECIQNTTMLASITLTVVNALAQSKPVLKSNDITPPRAVGGGGGGFGGGAGGGAGGGGGFGFGAGGSGPPPQESKPASPPAPSPSPAPAPAPAPAPPPPACTAPPCPPPPPPPPPCTPPACPAPAPAPAAAPAAGKVAGLEGQKGNVNVQSDVKINMDGKKANDCPPGKRDCVPSTSTLPDGSKGASVVVNGVPVKLPTDIGRRK